MSRLILATGRIQDRPVDMLDITVKSASTPEGRVMAPTWEMVQQFKVGQLTEKEYAEQYLALLRARWKDSEQRKQFISILKMESVTLCCYCQSGAFCHRLLAADILSKIAASHDVKVECIGEVMQLSLFD